MQLSRYVGLNSVITGSLLLLLLASQVHPVNSYFYPSILLPLTVGPGAWIGIYGLIGVKMVYILAVLSLSRIEYLYRLERKWGDKLKPDPRIALMHIEEAYHGPGPPPPLSHFGWNKRKQRRAKIRRPVARKKGRVVARPRLRKRPSVSTSIHSMYGTAISNPPRPMPVVSEEDRDQDQDTLPNYPQQQPGQSYYGNYGDSGSAYIQMSVPDGAGNRNGRPTASQPSEEAIERRRSNFVMGQSLQSHLAPRPPWQSRVAVRQKRSATAAVAALLWSSL